MECKEIDKNIPACEGPPEDPNIVYLNEMTRQGFMAAVNAKLRQWYEEDGLIYEYRFRPAGGGRWYLKQNLNHEELMAKFQRL